MKSQSHIQHFFWSHYLIKKTISKKKKKISILQCIQNGQSNGIWNQCFLFFFSFFFKKTLNWTRGTKLNNNWNPIQNLIGFSFIFDFNYIYRLVIGLCVVRFFWYDFFFLGKYYGWRTFFWEKNFFHFYVVILKIQ